MTGDLSKPAGRREFRDELSTLQQTLRSYTRALAAMVDVEDLTSLEDAS